MQKRSWKEIAKFFRFSVVGTLSFMIMLIITVLFAEYFLVHYYISYAIGLLFAYVYNFYFNMKLTFVAGGHTVVRLERFAMIGLLISFLCWAGVLFFVEVLEANYLFAIFFVQLGLSFLNFRLEEVWVFARIPESRHHRLR